MKHNITRERTGMWTGMKSVCSCGWVGEIYTHPELLSAQEQLHLKEQDGTMTTNDKLFKEMLGSIPPRGTPPPADARFPIISASDELSGRIMFICSHDGANDEEEDYASFSCDYASFSCGPECSDGALYDQEHEPTYDFLRNLFSDYPEINVGECESEHSLQLKPDQTKTQAYADIRERLIRAGAIEKIMGEDGLEEVPNGDDDGGDGGDEGGDEDEEDKVEFDPKQNSQNSRRSCGKFLSNLIQRKI